MQKIKCLQRKLGRQVVHRSTGRAGHLNSGQAARNPSPDYATELLCEGATALRTAVLAPLSVPRTVHIGTGLGAIVSGSATRVSLSKGQSLSGVEGSLGRQVSSRVYFSSGRKTAPTTKTKMGNSLNTAGQMLGIFKPSREPSVLSPSGFVDFQACCLTAVQGNSFLRYPGDSFCFLGVSEACFLAYTYSFSCSPLSTKYIPQ